MSTITTPAGQAATPTPARARNSDITPIGTGQLLRTEFTKMFDTRSGFWLVASIGILAVLASGAVMAFGSDSAQNFDNYASAIGVPIAVILPVIALLSVTSEWSQRTGLTTFTLVPNRSRVVAAKLMVSLGIGVAAMFVALTVGAIGNLAGSAVHGVDPVWGVTVGSLAKVVLANILGMLMGFMFGTVVRNSPAAIVAYFVYSMVLPQLFGALAFFQDWFESAWSWVDFFYSTTKLYDGAMAASDWAAPGCLGPDLAGDPADHRPAQGGLCRGEVVPGHPDLPATAPGRSSGRPGAVDPCGTRCAGGRGSGRRFREWTDRARCRRRSGPRSASRRPRATRSRVGCRRPCAPCCGR